MRARRKMQAMPEASGEVQAVHAEEHEQPGPYPIEKLQVRSMRETAALRTLCCRRLAERVACTQELGVAASDIKKLKEGGINTVESLAHSTKKELCAIKGISEAKVAKMQTEGACAPFRTCPQAGCRPCLCTVRQRWLVRSVEGGAHGLHHGVSDCRAAGRYCADHHRLQGV